MVNGTNGRTTTGFLTPATLALISLALEEDLGRGDITSEVVFGSDDRPRRGRIVAKEPLVWCGGALVPAIFEKVDPRITVAALLEDGALLAKGQTVCEVEGPIHGLLAGERTVLNFVQRLSGIATLTRRFVDLVAGTGAAITDTRKTTPGWRRLDKLAVACGGGHNHRADLGSGVLIKDNHIVAAGGVKAALDRAQAKAPHPLRVEIEVTTLKELDDALLGKAEIVLLDNMTPEQVAHAVARIAGRALVEVSGGITLETARLYAEAGADLISVGAITHSARAVDLSLEL